MTNKLSDVSDQEHAHFDAAHKRMKNKDYKGAYQELKQGLALDPSSYYGHRTIGYVAQKLGRYQEAKDQYIYVLNEYFRFDQINGYWHIPIQEKLRRPEDRQEFLMILEALIRASFVIALRTKAESDFRQSLSYFDCYLRYDPEYTWLDAMRAWCLAELGDYQAAETILNKWLRLKPEMLRPYFVMARLRFYQKDLKQAANYYLMGLKLRFKNWDISDKDQQGGHASRLSF